MSDSMLHKQSNACPDLGVLVSLRDGELTIQEEQSVRAHLAECPGCAAEERALQTTSSEVYDLFEDLNPAPEHRPDTIKAFALFKTKLEKEPLQVGMTMRAAHNVPLPVMTKKRSHPVGLVISAIAAVLLLAILVTPTASVLADQFLSLFKVQKFEAVNIDPTKINTAFLQDLNELGELQYSGDQGSVSSRIATQAEAQKVVGFPLKQPTYVPASAGKDVTYNLIRGGKVTFTFDVTKTRAYLQKSGQSNVRFPAQLEGSSFTFTVKAGVVTNYSKAQCQEAENKKCLASSMFIVAQIPSPVLEAKGKATIKDLRDFVASLPKLSPQLRDILQKVDIEKGTIPVPVPPQVRTKQVTVQGSSGMLIAEESYKMSAVLWQKDDIIYAVGLDQVGGQEALKVAESMR